MAKYIKIGGNALNITGRRFGKLIALGPVSRKHKEIIWECLCDCGNETTTVVSSLRAGLTQSCGCLHRERARMANITHGMSKTPIFKTWKGITQRCTNPNNPAFKNYGERGIVMCDEWQQSFEAFYAHVSHLSNFSVKGYTLDRANNDLGYLPGNMRWATRTEQNRNKRVRQDSRLLTHNGKTQHLTTWAKELGIRQSAIRDRLHDGWSVERALTIPVRPKKKNGEG